MDELVRELVPQVIGVLVRRGADRSGRSSSHSRIGSPPGPGAAESSPASSTARS